MKDYSCKTVSSTLSFIIITISLNDDKKRTIKSDLIDQLMKSKKYNKGNIIAV
uniref:Uncharacterized protein n=1 Tax=Octopus bimaculoides TaxID=37653 RepID=A0A0L8H7A4_OCTBM